MLSLAFWVSLTRISDYFHHPYDVVTGALVGIVFAVTTMLVMADVFNKR
jgi:membrane-associated phospholipid phosphatase